MFNETFESTTSSNKLGTAGKLTVLAAVALFGASFALTGCNTTEGAGEDIEAAGDEIQDAAD